MTLAAIGVLALSVLVARRDIPKGTPLDEAMLTSVSVPDGCVGPGALTTIADSLGRVTAVDVLKGSQVLRGLTFSLEEAAVTFTLPEGYRTFTFTLDAGAPLGDVRPGGFVDVIRLAPKGKGSVASTVLQNVQVLAVGSDIGGTDLVFPREKPAPGRSRTDPPTLSVIVTPEQADRLERAVETGRLRVALRSLWESDPTAELGGPTSESPLPLRPLPVSPCPPRTP